MLLGCVCVGSMGSTWAGWATLSRVERKKETEPHTHKLASLGPGPQGSKIPVAETET